MNKNFPTRIRSLTPTGAGLDTSDATATASDIATMEVPIFLIIGYQNVFVKAC